jgi:hypothetical protein
MPGLIRPDALWRVVEPVDIRRGVEGLSLHVQQTLGAAGQRAGLQCNTFVGRLGVYPAFLGLEPAINKNACTISIYVYNTH